jgi:hypothetical protein
MDRASGQQAAWETYLAVTWRVLPVLDDFPATDADAIINRRLGGVVIRVRRYAPLWGEHGPMLVAAASSLVRLYRQGDFSALGDLLRLIARRLYQLSASPAARGKPHNQRRPGSPQTFRLPPFSRPPGNDRSDQGGKGSSEDD